jgi:crotonobetainyl-CoA:carnitine CoA-transferase CaiB-like acyl-CoA transferase
MTGVLLDSHWRRLVALMGQPALADDPRYATAPARIERRREVDELLAGWLAERPLDEVLAALSAEGIPAAPVRTYAEAASDPHVAAREMLQDVPRVGGAPLPITGPAAKLSRTPIRVRSGAPELGAHGPEILRELGLDAEAIRRLAEAGVIGAPDPDSP